MCRRHHGGQLRRANYVKASISGEKKKPMPFTCLHDGADHYHRQCQCHCLPQACLQGDVNKSAIGIGGTSRPFMSFILVFHSFEDSFGIFTSPDGFGIPPGAFPFCILFYSLFWPHLG